MRISDWSSDVCSSDLQQPDDRCAPGDGEYTRVAVAVEQTAGKRCREDAGEIDDEDRRQRTRSEIERRFTEPQRDISEPGDQREQQRKAGDIDRAQRSEEHTSELQSLMRNSYAVFCLKKKKQK